MVTVCGLHVFPIIQLVYTISKKNPSIFTVKVMKQRNRNFYIGNWSIIELTYKTLYKNYLLENPDKVVSYGSFFSLKPFYIRGTTTKDIEMCCCKKHVHARNAVNGLIELCKKEKIELNFTLYDSFFEYLNKDCPSDPHTYFMERQKCLQLKCDSLSSWKFLAKNVEVKDFYGKNSHFSEKSCFLQVITKPKCQPQIHDI